MTLGMGHMCNVSQAKSRRQGQKATFAEGMSVWLLFRCSAIMITFLGSTKVTSKGNNSMNSSSLPQSSIPTATASSGVGY